MQTDSLPEIARQIGPLIDVLSTKLNVPARYVWEVMIKQVYIDFIITTIGFMTALFIFRFFYKKTVTYKGYDIEGWLIASGISALVCLFFGIGFLIDLGDLLNPPHAVIKEFFNLAKD